MSQGTGRPGYATLDAMGTPRRRQVAQAVVSLAVVGAVFVGVLPRIADLSEVGRQIGAMTAVEVATLMAVALWNLLTYLFVWVASLPGLRYGQAAVATQSTTALANTVPAGAAVAIALAYSMFSSWGFKRSAITLAMLVSGVWNNFVKLGLPVLALALLAVSGEAGVASTVAGVAGIATLVAAVVVFALMLRRETTVRRVGLIVQRVAAPVARLVRRGAPHGWDQALISFRSRTIHLLGSRWHWLTLATVVSHLSLFLVLLVALRHVGVSEDEVGSVEVLAAFAFVRLLGAIPITPGGLGVIELGLIAGLVAAGGDRAQVVASVLVYRSLTYLLPIPVGVICYAIWRRNQRWRRTPPSVETVPA
jgi:putative heme transporter